MMRCIFVLFIIRLAGDNDWLLLLIGELDAVVELDEDELFLYKEYGYVDSFILVDLFSISISRIPAFNEYKWLLNRHAGN